VEAQVNGVNIDGSHRRKLKKISALLSPSEHVIQAAYFQWVRLRYPDLKLIYATPNAAKRSPQLARYMLAEGLTAGIPDVNIDIPRGDYAGARIEFKKRDGRVTPEQKEAQRQLAGAGYWVIECRSTEAAIDATKSYLGDWQWQ
jgi:hypothetical protein